MRSSGKENSMPYQVISSTQKDTANAEDKYLLRSFSVAVSGTEGSKSEVIELIPLLDGEDSQNANTTPRNLICKDITNSHALIFVKKAVGLGGWHWLVLTNGIEAKLQRNALSVIEAPTGNEEDDDLEFESFQRNGSDMGELLDDAVWIHEDLADWEESSSGRWMVED